MVCWLCYLTIHREKDAYLPAGVAVRKELRRRQFDNIYLEFTYQGYFSEELRRLYHDDLAFEMASLGGISPDIMCYAETYDAYLGQRRSLKVVIEVKRPPIFKIGGIFQAAKYGMQFQAGIAMLISPQGVSERLLEYMRLRPELLTYGNNGKVVLGHLDVKSRTITTWVPRLPI
jgi:hypothetical protein